VSLDTVKSNDYGESLSTTLSKTMITIIAWAVILVASLLPQILFRELTGSIPGWVFWAKVGLLGSGLLVSLVWRKLRPLGLFFLVLLAFFVLSRGVGQVFTMLGYTTWLEGTSPFIRSVGEVQITRFVTATLMVLLMLVVLRRRERFFFVRGKLDAYAAPIPLIKTPPTTWRILGPAIAGAMCLGLLVFIFVFGRPPSLAVLPAVIPLLPFILLFAAVNAYGEEMLYRAPLLAALESPVGAANALLMTAVFFGIDHFYGVPYGVLGVLMSFIPGYLMGKAMLETRGFFWAWFIHLCMDIVIFFMMALGSVTPGG
jgi:membrane protease YdiL (CAAX protease family)